MLREALHTRHPMLSSHNRLSHYEFKGFMLLLQTLRIHPQKHRLKTPALTKLMFYSGQIQKGGQFRG